MVELMENDLVVGGYIVPNNNDAKKFITEHCRREGYIEYKKINYNS